jgi:SAM-dependent methyltransferase
MYRVPAARSVPEVSSPEFDADAFHTFEAAGWEKHADGYHRFFAPITTRVTDQLLDACQIHRGSRVLDVATGPGYVAAACAERGASVTGVDIASEMVKLARQLHSEINFRQSDAARLPFTDNSFDAVTGNFAILHVGRPERAATEFSRVLAPGGAVALSTWDSPDRCRLAGVFADAVSEVAAPPPAEIPPGPPFFRFASDSEFTNLLAGAGFADIRVRAVSFTHLVPSADALWDGLLGGTVRTRASILGQPPETQRHIRAAFDQLVAEYHGEGGLHMPVSVKVASARKPGHPGG